MDTDRIQVRARGRDFLDGFEFVVQCRGESGLSMVAALEFEPVESGLLYNPSFTIGHDEAQQLMDDLYRSGLRPTDAEDGSGTKMHLSDMRAIVANKLGVELGKGE